MAPFLQKDSSSDSDTDSTVSSNSSRSSRSSSSSNNNMASANMMSNAQQMSAIADEYKDLNLPPGVWKWLKRDGDGHGGGDSDSDSDSDEQTGALSKIDRAKNQVGELCDKVEYEMDAASVNFQKVIDALAIADPAAIKLIDTFQVLPKQYFQLLQFLSDEITSRYDHATKVLEEAGDDEEDDSEDEAAAADNKPTADDKKKVKEANEVKKSKTLARLKIDVQKKLAQYDSYIKRIETQGDSDEEGDESNTAGTNRGSSLQDLSER